MDEMTVELENMKKAEEVRIVNVFDSQCSVLFYSVLFNFSSCYHVYLS